MDFFGKSDPFLIISRVREDNTWVQVRPVLSPYFAFDEVQPQPTYQIHFAQCKLILSFVSSFEMTITSGAQGQDPDEESQPQLAMNVS